MRIPESPQRSGFHWSTGGSLRSSISFCSSARLDALEVDRWPGFGHGCVCHCDCGEAIRCVNGLHRHLLRNDGTANRHRHRRRQARRRAILPRRCSATAGRVVAHVHHADDEVPEGAIKVVADLADPDCAETSSSRRPTAAGRSAGQQCRALRVGRFWRVQRRRVRRAHGGQRARARASDRALRARARERDAMRWS